MELACVALWLRAGIGSLCRLGSGGNLVDRLGLGCNGKVFGVVELSLVVI